MYSIANRQYLIYLSAAIVSVLLSAWISGNESVINPDAICYLQSAATMDEGLSAAMNVCGQAKWPLYSLIVAGFVKLTALSYENAAYILNGLFSLLTVIAFVKITQILSYRLPEEKRIRLLWLAATVILLANEFNSIKHYIVRDHGFWAFYLLSIVFLLNFTRSAKWYDALLWSISMVIATLFRIEGAVFLLMMPFIVWFDGNSTYLARTKKFLQLNNITIVAGLLVCIWLFLHPEMSAGRLNDLQFQLLHGMSKLVDNFQLQADNLGKYVLSVHAVKDASLILFCMLMTWYVVSIMINLSFIYSVLAVYAWRKKLIVVEKAMLKVLWWYLILNLVFTLAFLFEYMFLSKRYLIALSLVCMLWVPFALDNLLQKWPQKKWATIAAFTLIFISSLGGIFEFGHSKKYIHDAGVWLDQHTPSNATIYSNDNLVMYYSHRFGNTLFEKLQEFREPSTIAQGKWKEYDYLALRVNKKATSNDQEIISLIDRKPVMIFSNKRGDEVRIYQLN